MNDICNIIAVDFDGTLCENKYPNIGEPNEELINYLKRRRDEGDKIILWTCRDADLLREAVLWCYSHGLIFDAVNENLPEIIESFGSDTRKIFANIYIDDQAMNCYKIPVFLCNREQCGNKCSYPECRRTFDVQYAKNFRNSDGGSFYEEVDETNEEEAESNIIRWAKNEVRLACERDRQNMLESDELDCRRACYDSAIKALKSLINDGHSGFSINLTRQILVRLIDRKPLTPIEDTDDIWNKIYEHDGVETYQCCRMPSLFKDVSHSGTVTYHDLDRSIGLDHNSPDAPFYDNLVSKIVDEMFPVSMPYIPENIPFRVVCEYYLTDRNNGDFDTAAIQYILKPDGNKVLINRYFKSEELDFEEISVSEFVQRKHQHYDRIQKESSEEANSDKIGD